MDASNDTLWVKDLPSGLKIIVKAIELPGGAKGVGYWLQSPSKAEIPIKASDVEALMSMSAG